MERSELKLLIEQVVKGKCSVGSLVNRLLYEMGRGGVMLLVDENLLGLAPFLRMLNYTVETLPRKFSDERLKPQIRDRVFITLNGRDFCDSADMQKYYYGLVWVIRNPDDKTLSKRIERALMKANFRHNLTQVVKI